MRRTIAALAAGLGAVALAAVGMGATGCTTSSAGSAKKDEPATVEKLPGDQVRITLTADAARRLDIQTGTIGGGPASILAAGGTSTTTLPYAALLYDAQGQTSAYTVPAPLTYVRQPVTVQSITGDRVVLSDGPPAGTVVVTVGAAELLGVESGVGHK